MRIWYVSVCFLFWTTFCPQEKTEVFLWVFPSNHPTGTDGPPLALRHGGLFRNPRVSLESLRQLPLAAASAFRFREGGAGRAGLWGRARGRARRQGMGHADKNL